MCQRRCPLLSPIVKPNPVKNDCTNSLAVLKFVTTTMILFIFAFLPLFEFTSETYINYCDLRCDDLVNILCDNNCVGKCIPIHPDYAWRVHVTALHNKYRSQVAGGNETRGNNSQAGNMRAMSYDMYLEYSAACYIYSMNVPQRAPCRRTAQFNYVGQNIYFGKLNPETEEGLKSIILTWYDEADKTTAEIIDTYMASIKELDDAAAFTQLIWANSSRVGCGRCQSRENGDNILVACNYGPGGNRRGMPVYRRGQPASQCDDEEKNKDYPFLCGEIDNPPNMRLRGIISNSVVGTRRMLTGSFLYRLLPLIVALIKPC